MINQQLLAYVEQQLEYGIEEEEIKSILLGEGWSEGDVDEAFAHLNNHNETTIVEATTTSDSESTSAGVKSGAGKTLAIAALAVLLVIGAGAGVWGYFNYFRETPEEIIAKMIERLGSLQTIEYQGEMDIYATIPESASGLVDLGLSEQPVSDTQTNVNFAFAGKYDFTNLSNSLGVLTFTLKTDMLKEMVEQELAVDGEVRLVGGGSYVRLDNLPDLGFMDLGLFNDQWVKLDLGTFSQQLTEAEGILKQGGPTPEQFAQLRRDFPLSRSMHIVEKTPYKEIPGVDTHQLVFTVNMQELKNFSVAYWEMLAQAPGGDSVFAKEMLDFTNQALSSIESFGGEIWIGKEDFLPYKFKWSATTRMTGEIEAVGTTTTTVMLKNHNKQVSVEQPSSFRSMEEVANQLFGLFFMGMMGVGPGQQDMLQGMEPELDFDSQLPTDPNLEIITLP